MTAYDDATDCPICPMIATDRDDALGELRAVMDRLREMFGIDATEPDAIWDAIERYDAHNLSTIDSLRDHLQMQTHLAQLNYLEQQRWQEMAEDLWEELQEWHYDDCSFANPGPLGPTECICHRILAAKWNEITHAADWNDDGDDE